jgi:hypothetical protein
MTYSVNRVRIRPSGKCEDMADMICQQVKVATFCPARYKQIELTSSMNKLSALSVRAVNSDFWPSFPRPISSSLPTELSALRVPERMTSEGGISVATDVGGNEV